MNILDSNFKEEIEFQWLKGYFFHFITKKKFLFNIQNNASILKIEAIKEYLHIKTYSDFRKNRICFDKSEYILFSMTNNHKIKHVKYNKDNEINKIINSVAYYVKRNNNGVLPSEIKLEIKNTITLWYKNSVNTTLVIYMLS